MVKHTPYYDLDSFQCIAPAIESHLIHFWRLFPSPGEEQIALGKSHRLVMDFSDHIQLSGGVYDRDVWILKKKEMAQAGVNTSINV